MKFKPVLLSTVVTVLVSSGCSNNSSRYNPAEIAKLDTVTKQSAAIGCFAGALIATDPNKRNLLLLKCLIGGYSGYLVGRSISKRRAAYRNLEQQVNGEISHTAKLNKQLKKHISDQQKDLLKYKFKIQRATKDGQALEKDLVELTKLYKELLKVDKDEKKSFNNLMKEVQFKEETASAALPSGLSQQEAKLQREITLLKENIKLLQVNRATLASYKRQVTEVLL